MICCLSYLYQTTMSAKYRAGSEQAAPSGGLMTSQHHFSSNYYATGVTCKQEQSSYATINSLPVMSGLHGQQIGPEEEKMSKSFVKTEQGMDSSSSRYYQMQISGGQHCPPSYHSPSSIKEEIKPLNYQYDVQSVYSQSEASIPSTSYRSNNHFLFQSANSCQATNFNHQVAYADDEEDSNIRKNGEIILFFMMLKFITVLFPRFRNKST